MKIESDTSSKNEHSRTRVVFEIGDNLASVLMVLAVYSPFIILLMIGVIYAIAFTLMIK